MFTSNNARFCCQNKEQVLSSNTFGRTHIWTKKNKNLEPYWWQFRKKVHGSESGGESDDKT